MRKRTVLSDKELLEQFSDEKFPEDPDIGRACFENLLTGKRGKGTLPHLGKGQGAAAASGNAGRVLCGHGEDEAEIGVCQDID